MKKNKIFYTCALGVIVSAFIHAQTQRQNPPEKSLAQRLGLIEKKLDGFNMYMNFRTNLNSSISNNNYQGSYFAVDQLRFEMMGNISDRISYRFRQRFNKSSGPGLNAVDALSSATDFAFIAYKPSDQLSIIAGKQSMAMGSIEADYNPIYIYQYSDIFQNMNVFYTGVSVVYKPVKDHEIRFQVLNNSTDRMLEVYDYEVEDQNNGTKKHVAFTKEDFKYQGIETVKTPLGYSLNWNGDLWGDMVQTRWSYSIFQEAKKNYWKLLAIGTQFNLRPVTIEADYIRSDEDLDREVYATQVFRRLKNDNKLIATNVSYNTYLLKVRCNFTPQWNIFVKGVYETAYSKDIPNLSEKTFRKAYSYFGGLEYMPIKNSDNMRLYLIYRGHRVDYPYEKIKDLSSNTHYISLGLIYRLKML